ncbi:unnamed protein product [Ectocarpus sp. CCAP 1310/34]|nr:unnamed protein product [Ectocarpus sp. CCAP 1310/34]
MEPQNLDGTLASMIAVERTQATAGRFHVTGTEGRATGLAHGLQCVLPLAQRGNGGDQGPVKDEENRKRGVDAQGEEDGGGGSASDEGGEREGESIGGQPPDGGKVVGPKTGSNKKRLDPPSPQISIPPQMVALAEKHHEE